MNRECCVQDVKAIYQIIDEHATAVYRAGRPRLAKLGRWSNWLSMIGIWLVAINLIAYHALTAMRAHPGWVLGVLAFAVGGLAVMLIGTVLMVVDSLRTMKPPLTELYLGDRVRIDVVHCRARPAGIRLFPSAQGSKRLRSYRLASPIQSLPQTQKPVSGEPTSITLFAMPMDVGTVECCTKPRGRTTEPSRE
jgi:hypothetical protein